MTPASLKSARKALGKSMQGLAEDLGYSGKHAWKNIQLMENGAKPIPERVNDSIRPLLISKRDECTSVWSRLAHPSEPTGAPHSEKWTLTGVVRQPPHCYECGLNAANVPDHLCSSCRASRED